ncbi:MAG: YHYH protein [Acidobacteria bacterium]|nr:YHYH protein [Acidobacteriota bacterium]
MKNWKILIVCAGAAIAQPPMQQGDGVWARDAYFGEAQTFDACTGHQPGNGQYHHHASPTCLRAQLNDNLELVRDTRTGPVYREKAAGLTHSPILGWAFDGHPIYGPYGYADARNASSPVRRMRSAFRLRNITQRNTLAEWSRAYLPAVPATLAENQYGPPINATFPLGRYIEDYEFAAGLGDLDVYNGRTAVTPEFPGGTYAYFVTIDETGKPAFPYILGRQFYGTLNGGNAQAVPAAAQEYTSGGDSPYLTAWRTAGAQTPARVRSAFDPSSAASNTWPFETIAGARTAGGVTTPTNADIQRIRFTDSDVYVNSNNLGAYVMGPWFDALQPGGVFGNWPSRQNAQFRVTRNPAAASTRTNTGLGAVGVFVNGVAVFNMLDGATYSTARQADVGGGLVSPTALHVSAASFERGPFAKGALVTAFSQFGSTLAASTATAATANWPTSLAGTEVLIRDAGGVAHQAPIYYASPTQVNYRIPEAVAVGFAVVTVSANGVSYGGNIHIRDVYPNLFTVNNDGLAAAYFSRLRNGQSTAEPVSQAVELGTDTVYAVLFGTGLGGEKDVTATVGGIRAGVAYAGPQGAFGGLDQFNIVIPSELAGRGRVEVVLTAGGKTANTVYFNVR